MTRQNCILQTPRVAAAHIRAICGHTLRTRNITVFMSFFLLYIPIRHYKKFIEFDSAERQEDGLSFQSAIKLPIIIAQCFGLFPVIGVNGTDASKLRFTFWSGRYWYSTMTILVQTVVIFFNLMEMFNSDSTYFENPSIIFFFMTTVIGLLFFRIATKWPTLCKYIAKTEAEDPVRDKNLPRNCKAACILVLGLAAVEHILADISGINTAMYYQPNTPIYDAYMLQSYHFAWTFICYNPIIGFIIKITTIQCTFNWNFADAFVICVSLYLTSRLQQINDRIVAVRGKFAPALFYRRAREDYTKIVAVIRKTDEVINGVIFVSFAINVFIICMQLLHAIKPVLGYVQAIYFIYSFSFLLMRSLAVSLIASKVHTASRTSAEYLYDVPPSAYCSEVQRFLNQVHCDDVALTGLKFFNVKRGLVLTITATIITYELVLVQFAGVTPTLQPTTV